MIVDPRRLRSLFEASLYAILAIPFSMIAVGGGVGPVLTVIFVVGLVASWFFHRAGLARDSHAPWFGAFVILWVVGSAVELAITEISILDSGIRFVLVLTLVKLFGRLGPRDDWQLYALSFLMLAAATTVNEDLTFGLLFSAYVLVGTFSLAVFHLHSEYSARPLLALRSSGALNGAYVAVLAGMGALILASSISIFFAFPRIGLGFFRQQARDGAMVTGMSGSVELGQHGVIRDNPDVVLRVEFPDGPWEPPESIHWRMMTFDHYDGRRWSQTRKRSQRTATRTGRMFEVGRRHNSGGAGPRAQIYAEPLGTNIVPAVRPTHGIQLGSDDAPRFWGPKSGIITVDHYGDIRHTVENELGLLYVLTVGKAPTAPPRARRFPGDESLQLPERQPRVDALARDITKNATDPDQAAAAIVDYLRDNYSYTTDLPVVQGSPVEAFLFETKRGHCEYFATTMVVLMRAAGYHTRLVNGFLGGRWNEVGNYLAVRQGDAHSWVEYWTDDRGWVMADPTPASEVVPNVPSWDRARQYWDTMRLFWTKWVIEYDLISQIEAFKRVARVLEPRGLQGGGEDSPPNAQQSKESDWRRAITWGGLVTLAFLAFVHVRRRFARGGRTSLTTFFGVLWVGAGSGWMAWFVGPTWEPTLQGAAAVALGVTLAYVLRRPPAESSAIHTAFERVEAAAKRRHNMGRSKAEPPGAFLARLAEKSPAVAEDLERFRRLYHAARFSGVPCTDDDIERLERLAHKIARDIRN